MAPTNPVDGARALIVGTVTLSLGSTGIRLGVDGYRDRRRVDLRLIDPENAEARHAFWLTTDEARELARLLVVASTDEHAQHRDRGAARAAPDVERLLSNARVSREAERTNGGLTCIVCACRDSGATGGGLSLMQGAAATTVAFVLEEGITAARDGLCAAHRRLVEHGRAVQEPEDEAPRWRLPSLLELALVACHAPMRATGTSLVDALTRRDAAAADVERILERAELEASGRAPPPNPDATARAARREELEAIGRAQMSAWRDALLEDAGDFARFGRMTRDAAGERSTFTQPERVSLLLDVVAFVCERIAQRNRESAERLASEEPPQADRASRRGGK